MKLSIRPLALPEIKLIGAPRFRDERGYFAETYVRRDFAAAGIPHEFVQDNESLSHAPGTVRVLQHRGLQSLAKLLPGVPAGEPHLPEAAR